MTETFCDWFRELAPELAFGTLESHSTAELLDHAAGCLSCQTHLDRLSLIGDRLLLAGPQISPPVGFEDRAIASMLPPPPDEATVAHSLAPWCKTALVSAAAAALIGLSIGGGYVAGRGDMAHPVLRPAVDNGRTGTILRGDGTVAGTITLSSLPRPLALVTIDKPRPGVGVVTCELVASNGQATTIGTWTFDQVARGAWAVGIEPALLTAQRMDIRNAAGAILATATLH